MKTRWGTTLRLALIVASIAGCASPPPPRSSSPPPADQSPPGARPARPADLNLRGYPVSFREGYAAGCDSGRNGDKRRDETRYKADMNYMMGWNDGYSICVPRK